MSGPDPLSAEADAARFCEMLLLQRAQFDAEGLHELNRIFNLPSPEESQQ